MVLRGLVPCLLGSRQPEPDLDTRQCQDNHRNEPTLLHTQAGPQPVRTAAGGTLVEILFVSCLGTMANTCNPGTGEAKAGRLSTWNQPRPQSKTLLQNNRRLFTPGWQVKACPHGGRTLLRCGPAQLLCHFPTRASSFLACLGSGVALCGRVSTHLGGR